MEDDQQFCLRWNNHQSTLIQNFDTLLESGTLVDCTLAAEGKTLKAHKVVLSACSPYFECLLSEHYDKHPVFILKDVKFKELKAMMDYMYRGEVNISQDQLAALLKAAESLQIKGLSESKTASSSKTESRPQKTVSQPTAPSLDIPHASSGLTIEKNKVPRQSLAPSSVGDTPEDTASPQVSKGLSSREGSQSPISRKRKRFRRRSLTEDNTTENQDASNSSDMPQQMGVPALGIAPVADEKVHADPTDSLGRSALMTQLTKPADEMLQLPLEKPEPNDNLIEPKSEYLDDAEEGVEDLTLDEEMNDFNDTEQDNSRAGPSHDTAQHTAGLGSWHVTGDRSNAGGVVGSVAGAAGTTDEVFLAAQEAAQAHRDSQEAIKTDISTEELERLLAEGISSEGEKLELELKPESEEQREKSLENKRKYQKENRKEDQKDKTKGRFKKSKRILPDFTNEKPSTSKSTTSRCTRSTTLLGFNNEEPSTSKSTTSRCTRNTTGKLTRSKSITAQTPPVDTNQKQSEGFEVISIVSDSQNSDDELSPTWTDTKCITKVTNCYSCPYKCGATFERLSSLYRHIKLTCLLYSKSKTNMDAGRYKCMECGRNYAYLKSLRYHQKHECKQKITCLDCGKTMRGSFVTERHKQRFCVNKQRKSIKQELSPEELFVDDSSIDYTTDE